MYTGRILTVAALTILATGLASADMIVTTDATPVGPTLTDFPWTLTFGSTATPAGFHLVGATLEVSDTVADPVLSLTNTASTPQTFTFTATSEAAVTGNSVDGTLVSSATIPTTILSTGLVTFSVGQTIVYSPLSLAEEVGPAAVSDPAGYLAGAMLTGDTLSGTSFVGGGGNIEVNQVQDATITGQLVFDFAPNTSTVPEPATIFLCGTALLGFCWFQRKRQRTN